MSTFLWNLALIPSSWTTDHFPLARSSVVEPATHNGLVAGSNPAAPTNRFVLDKDRFMAEIEQPPAFIVMPSQGYLLACEREQTDVILDFLNGN